MKKCGKCQEVKPLADYQKNKTKPDGHQSWCKVCQRPQVRLNNPKRDWTRYDTFDYQLRSKYGITIEDWWWMYMMQNGCCLICKKHKKLVVDHDHTHGHVRGLLCGPCNTGLGSFHDDPDCMIAASNYILNDRMENITNG